MLSLLAVVACAPAPITLVTPDPVGDDPAVVFDPERLVEVAITLDAADWDAMREETRDIWDIFGGDCLAQPVESPFEWYHGRVSIDGEELADVGVRKKGFLGSLSDVKPSIKMKFDKYVDGARFSGLQRMSLNNVQQDPSLLHTCLSYAVFRDAGVPAPRCNFAHVTVNGTDLGVYADVETVDDVFLASRFADPSGPLYEGTVSDFREGWEGTFDIETKGADLAPIDAVRVALDSPDDSVLDALGAVIDLDAYYDFWATESLVGHWDGYDGNTNNFYVYEDPATGRLHFIPWGTDAALDSETPFGEGAPVWVTATAALPRRLLRLEEGDAAYRSHLAAVMDRAWDAEAIVDEIDRMKALLAPYTDITDAARDVKQVVRGRAEAIAAGIDGPAPSWDTDLRDPPCFVPHGTISSTFETTWYTYNTVDPWTTGSATLDVVFDGSPIPVVSTGAVAGIAADGSGTAVVLVAAKVDDDTSLVPYVSFDPTALVPGTTLPLDFTAASGQLLYADPSTGGQFVSAAYMADGRLTLDDAAMRAGAPVRGTIEADLVTFGAGW
jgi:hypothetical protein